MTSLAVLWLPLLLAAVIVFIASSVIHMVLPWHKSDFSPLPDEEAFRTAVGPMRIPPGDYMVPRPGSMADLKNESYRRKVDEGPRLVMTVMPNGWRGMSRELTLWFVYVVIVLFFAAYIASRALAPGAPYAEVFRFIGASAFLGFAGALWQQWIWYGRSAKYAIGSTIDGLVYAFLAAGTFGWLWPR